MESMNGAPTPQDAAAALNAAERARTDLADAIVVPRGTEGSIGAAIAVQLATTGLGLGVEAAWARWALVGGVLLFGAVALVAVVRLRRANGVHLGGFTGRVVLGTGTGASLAYAAALAASVGAAFHDLWWLVALCSVAGGVGYVVGGRIWWRGYRREPARHAPGESAAYLAAVAVLAVVGLGLLVALR